MVLTPLIFCLRRKKGNCWCRAVELTLQMWQGRILLTPVCDVAALWFSQRLACPDAGTDWCKRVSKAASPLNLGSLEEEEHIRAEQTVVLKHSRLPKSGEDKITRSKNAVDIFTDLWKTTEINYTLPAQIIIIYLFIIIYFGNFCSRELISVLTACCAFRQLAWEKYSKKVYFN